MPNHNDVFFLYFIFQWVLKKTAQILYIGKSKHNMHYRSTFGHRNTLKNGLFLKETPSKDCGYFSDKGRHGKIAEIDVSNEVEELLQTGEVMKATTRSENMAILYNLMIRNEVTLISLLNATHHDFVEHYEIALIKIFKPPLNLSYNTDLSNEQATPQDYLPFYPETKTCLPCGLEFKTKKDKSRHMALFHGSSKSIHANQIQASLITRTNIFLNPSLISSLG